MANIPNELRKIQQNKPPYASGQPIETVICSACGAANEQHKRLCYVCGAVLGTTEVSPKPSPQSSSGTTGVIIIILVLGCVIGGSILGGLGSGASSRKGRETPIPTRIPTATPLPPVPSGSRIKILGPNEQTVFRGDPLNFPIELDPKENDIATLLLEVSYNASDLRFLGVTPSPAFANAEFAGEPFDDPKGPGWLVLIQITCHKDNPCAVDAQGPVMMATLNFRTESKRTDSPVFSYIIVTMTQATDFRGRDLIPYFGPDRQLFLEYSLKES